ncbi:hypothetical protein BS78_02G185500 [Paspalum vaginatum]|nr:hypothetical protein BS78_02G185500 [Paspalum vaginatum]
MELFAGRGPAPAACDGDCGFPEAPPTQYGDSSSSMLVIRDALLSQLHMDRLRQEIIEAELAKIERAMALRSADAEVSNTGAPFVLHEQMPHSSRGAVAVGPYHDVAADAGTDLTKKGGLRGGVGLEFDKPATTEEPVPECLKTCHASGSAAGQENDVLDECKPQASNEKARSEWLCRFCQSNCTCKSDLENHLRGKRHKTKIQALLEECKKIAANCASPEADPQPNTEADSSTWNCSLCQAKCNRQSDLANHLRGKRHLLNFLVLQVEAKQYLSEWGCGICQAKCNSVFQFEDHCSSMGHRQKVEALQRGGQNAGPGGLKTVASSDEAMEMRRVLYFCKLCNLHCNSKNTLSEHRRGKKHTEKVEKRMSLSFCEVCNVQCNSEKMLAHHRIGKTHLAKLHGC